MGRGRKPLNVQDITEDVRFKERKAGAVKAEAGTPHRPRSLSPEARKVWDKIIPSLVDHGLAKNDWPMLEQYCEVYVNWRRAQDVIVEKGPTYISPRGEPKARPEVAIAKTCLEFLLRVGGKFGLSPFDRNNITIAPVMQKNDTKAKYFK